MELPFIERQKTEEGANLGYLQKEGFLFLFFFLSLLFQVSFRHLYKDISVDMLSKQMNKT